MNSPLAVGVAGSASASFVAAQNAVWASLPMSLVAAADTPRLVAIDGAQPSWLDAVADAARSDVAGVLVVHPSAGVAADEVRALVDGDTRIAVETRWAAHPAVAEFAALVTDRVPDAALVDSVVVVDDARAHADVLLDQLSLLRAVFGSLTSVAFVAQTPHGYTVDGRTGVASVALSGVRSVGRAGIRLTVYGAVGEARLAVPTDAAGAPAVASVVDAAGEFVLPSWYESPSRAAWRRLRDAVTSGRALPDLTDLADDLDVVARVGW